MTADRTLRCARLVVAAAVGALLFISAAARAPAGDEPPVTAHSGCAAAGNAVDPAMLEKPTTLRKGIGRVTQKITTSSPHAQAFYDQGLAYLHNFVWIEAARSFHQALRFDGECAMCWLGLARAEQNMTRDVAAKRAVTEAQSLAARVSDLERTHIALRAQQMAAAEAPLAEEEQKLEEYRRAIENALARFPDDAELWILRGNATESGALGRGQFGGVASIAFYETALQRTPRHFGAEHYLVHSYENIGQHEKAAEWARRYSGQCPQIAHAQHMYGHVLPRLGKWREALAQFAKADAIEVAYAKAEDLRPGDDWHHVHNLDLLGYTYLRLGRPEEAERCFRRAYDTPWRYPEWGGWQQTAYPEYLLLRGRAEEALAAVREMSHRSAAARAAGAAVEGEILLALGRTAEARQAAARAVAAFAETKDARDTERKMIEYFVRPALTRLDAELALHDADPKTAADAILTFADQLAANPRFDAWGEGLFRLERIAEEAKRAGRSELVADIYARMKRIDPDYVPGSTVLAVR